MEIWSNAQMCVFMVRDEEPPIYLPCTGISNIEWGGRTEGVCQHCGSAMVGKRCPNCGGNVSSTTVHELGQAIMTLEGMLPQAASIFHLLEGTELLLCHKCRGDRSCFIAEETIMRFLHCRQVKKNMPDVAVLYPDYEECLHVIVSVECEVELYPDGMEST